ncbi:hypothetical protein CHX27_04105 [Flavobacterium aurantiibacter]|uniref:Uncharacterized protein n=1 Tax=Flavobacterium aurantiibacter TaxID=2023067 RepID=A0A255ZZD2_9FLAO|nr:hypothetical protein CHX27_04105 [Flavobacterium aurantiibacter]
MVHIFAVGVAAKSFLAAWLGCVGAKRRLKEALAARTQAAERRKTCSEKPDGGWSVFPLNVRRTAQKLIRNYLGADFQMKPSSK